MENLDARGMQSVTSYAPARIVLLAVARIIFGLLVGTMGAAVAWGAAHGEMKPTQPGDMPSWWMFLVGAALAFMGFCFVSGGLGRAVSAFARNCYIMAGPDGIAVRVPKQGWFGRFRMVEYVLRWNEIRQVVRFVQRINLIPVSSELRIEPQTGKRVAIPRHYFEASVKEIQQRLVAIQTTYGR